MFFSVMSNYFGLALICGWATLFTKKALDLLECTMLGYTAQSRKFEKSFNIH